MDQEFVPNMHPAFLKFMLPKENEVSGSMQYPGNLTSQLNSEYSTEA